jgi:putative spermidine/putrescine transport system permease protein
MAGVVYVPLIQSAVRSFGDPPSLQEYADLFSDGITMTVFWRTLGSAVVVTLVTLVLGYPYAYMMTRASARVRGLLMTVVLVPFWTSAMARNFAWLILLERNGPVDRIFQFFGIHDVVFYQTTTGVTIAMTQVMLPFMVLPLYSALAGIDRKLLLAAQGLGSTPVKAFWKVFWPLSKVGVMSGLVLVFTLSMGFYITPALLGSPQNSMIAQLISQRATQLLDFAAAGALGTFVLIVTLVLVGMANSQGGSISAISVVVNTDSPKGNG